MSAVAGWGLLLWGAVVRCLSSVAVRCVDCVLLFVVCLWCVVNVRRCAMSAA